MFLVLHTAVLVLGIAAIGTASFSDQCVADSTQSSSVLQRRHVTSREAFSVDEDVNGQGDSEAARFGSVIDAPSDCQSKVKLVMNTCVKYEKALKHALKSLRKAGFSRFHDVVVFRGGVPANSQPYRDDAGITYVNLTMKSYDFAGYSGLHRFRRDPRVCAHSYLYILDTVEFSDDFPPKFELWSALKPDELRMMPRPNCNMAAFGHGVLERFGSNFDYNFTKAEVVAMEFNWTSRPRKNPEEFASKVQLLNRRRFRGESDPFNTGFFRKRLHFGDFGLYKYILWGYTGDIGGGGKLLENAPGTQEYIRLPRTHDVGKPDVGKPTRML